MSVTRGDFLKQLGKSIPGMVFGSGAAMAAQKLIGKMAAASGANGPTSPTTAEAVTPKDAKTHFINSGPTGTNCVALTFDDGPTPGVTDRILDELKKRQLHATFFMIGERIASSPELARRVLAEGHEVGNHTYTHPNLSKMADSQVESEIEKTQLIMESIMDHRPRFFRPPYGALRQSQAEMLLRRNMRVTLWSVDTSDWSQPGVDKICDAANSNSKPGSIILCHDVHPQTAESVPIILDSLVAHDYRLATLSELLD